MTTVETTKSDLIIFQTTPTKLDIVPKSNVVAMNNIHLAISSGLMIAPEGKIDEYKANKLRL